MPIVLNNKPKRKVWRRPALIGAGVLVIVGGILTALELTDTTHFLHDKVKDVAVTASSETKGETENGNTTGSTTDNSTNSSSQSSTSQPGDEKSGTGSDTPVNLLAPSGNFVSAHVVPMTASLASVCNTTPGVNCQIVFTLGSTTKSLPVQATDRGGSTYWNSWTPKSIGLTAGKWKIQAVASKGSQTQTTDDALALEVTQ